MHGRRLVAVFPIDVLVCNRVNARLALHFNPHAIFDPDQSGKRQPALLTIRIFDEHCCFPVTAVGHKRIVCIEFFSYAVCFENALHTQHFLDLVTHGQLIFEYEGQILAKSNGTMLLVSKNPCAEFLAVFGVLLQRHQAVGCDLSHADARMPCFKDRRPYGSASVDVFCLVGVAPSHHLRCLALYACPLSRSPSSHSPVRWTPCCGTPAAQSSW